MRSSTFSLIPSLVAMLALLALLALLAFPHTCTAQTQADIKDCKDKWQENVTYFSANAKPIESSGYSLEYYNDYKLLTNKVTNETYCLYCSGVRPDGTAVPSSTIKAYIQIPVQRIALHDLPSIDFLEILGSLDLVVAVSSQSNVTSPCAAAGIGSGAIAAFNESFYDSVSVTFTSEPVAVLDKPIATVSLPDSLTPLAKANWIHFFAAFTNQENISIGIYDAIEKEYNCHRENVKNFTILYQIAWISYDFNTRAWNLMNDTFRNSLVYDAGGAFPAANRTHFTSLDTFHKVINGAWMVIDETSFGPTGNTFNDWLTLSGFVSGTAAGNATFIGTRNVFRTDRSQNKNGYSSWLERSPSRPDLILRDLIATQYPSYDTTYKQQVFLENWWHGDPIKYYGPSECNNTDSPLQPQNIGNCSRSNYTLPTPSIVDYDLDSHDGHLSMQEKFGMIFGITSGVVLVVAVSLLTVRFLKRRKIGFGEETTGFVRISDLD